MCVHPTTVESKNSEFVFKVFKSGCSGSRPLKAGVSYSVLGAVQDSGPRGMEFGTCDVKDDLVDLCNSVCDNTCTAAKSCPAFSQRTAPLRAQMKSGKDKIVTNCQRQTFLHGTATQEQTKRKDAC